MAQHLSGRNVNGAPEELAGLAAERDQIEQCSARIELDEEIDVALRAAAATGQRPKYAEISRAVSACQLE